MRSFISIELPEEIKGKIAESIKDFKKTESDVKWVNKENLHITLKFLGEVDDQKTENLVQLTTKAVSGLGSFKVNFKGLGTFPVGKKPRIIWVGTDRGGDKLCILAKNLEEIFSKEGYRKEERRFNSHITIGRVKDKGRGKLAEKIEAQKGSEFGQVHIDHINIMKSTLTQSGSIYKKIMEVKL